jgi:hypothetical protein
MFRRAWIAALLMACAIGVAMPAAAQTTNGVIAGVISDAQGGVLPGVTVTGRNPETGLTRTVVTEADGRYRLAALPPGRYERRRARRAGTCPAFPPGPAPGDAEHHVAGAGLAESVTVTGGADH